MVYTIYIMNFTKARFETFTVSALSHCNPGTLFLRDQPPGTIQILVEADRAAVVLGYECLKRGAHTCRHKPVYFACPHCWESLAPAGAERLVSEALRQRFNHVETGTGYNELLLFSGT